MSLKMLKKISLLVVATLLVACTSKSPDCTDPETQKSVIMQINEKIKSSGFTEDAFRNLLKNYVGANLDVKGKISELQFTLQNIVASKYDKDIDKYSCKADLISSYAGGEAVTSIEFTSQKSDGGKRHQVDVKMTYETIGSLMGPLIKDVSKEQDALVVKLRSQIGDENIEDFIKKYCEGLDKDERQCQIGDRIKRIIEAEWRTEKDSLTKLFLDDRKKFVEAYNGCVAFYKKNKHGMNSSDSLRKSFPKETLTCDGAYMAAVKLNISPLFHDEIGK